MLRKLSVLLIIIPILSFAQKKSEVLGYIINHDHQKINGSFFVSDFNSFETLEFKAENTSTFTKLKENDVIEYGSNNGVKYVKRETDIAYSTKVNFKEENPIFTNSTKFFNVMLEGEASLYFLAGHEIFFYSVNNGPLKQLVNPYYTDPINNLTTYTYKFRKQLYEDVFCDYKLTESYNTLQYNRKSLLKLFTNYNSCKGTKAVIHEDYKSNKSKIAITALVGYRLNNSKMLYTNKEVGNANSGNVNLGVEIANIFGKDKYELYFSTKIGKFDAQMQHVIKEGSQFSSSMHYDIDLKALYLYNNVGIRYNFFSKDNYKMFFDAALGLEYLINSEVKMDQISDNVVDYKLEQELENKTGVFFEFGLGLMFKNKFGAEIKYSTSREYISKTHPAYSYKIGNFGLNLRYRF